jgi:DNA polymerase
MAKAENPRATALRELHNHLAFLKDAGYTEIPVSAELTNLSSPPLSPRTPTSAAAQKQLAARPVAPPIVTHTTPLAGEDNVLQMKNIREEIGDCKRCKLCETRTNIVFGSGNPNARLVFVGEGPGADEDAQGLPFVGRAGKKLTEIIEKGMLLNRERDTYICNIVKCRPPGNRDPEAEEIAACRPFLEKQLAAIKPKVIVALGKPAASTLLGRTVAIGKERGIWQEFNGIKLMLTYHPSYLIRVYTLENRRAVMDDMNKVLAELNS